MQNMTVDCLFQKECNLTEIRREWPRSMDHETEVIILKKFLASLLFVRDPVEADVLLVPALAATVANRRLDGTGCLIHGECKNDWFEQLKGELHYIDDDGNGNKKPHLFLGTQDADFNHRVIIDYVTQKPNAHVISYGSGNPSETLVVPSVDVDPRRQPRNYLTAKLQVWRNANFSSWPILESVILTALGLLLSWWTTMEQNKYGHLTMPK